MKKVDEDEKQGKEKMEGMEERVVETERTAGVHGHRMWITNVNCFRFSLQATY